MFTKYNLKTFFLESRDTQIEVIEPIIMQYDLF